MPAGGPERVLWAACASGHPLDDRAAATVAGGFDCMSVSGGDLVALEREGGSVREAARRYRDAGAPMTILDPLLSWYPAFDRSNATGRHADAQNVDVDTMLRFAGEIEATSISVLGPFSGVPARHDEVVEALANLADRAALDGLRLHVEVIPTSLLPTIDDGWTLVRDVDRANVGLVLDMFHLGRSGCTCEQLDAIPANRIFHVQLCDAPVEPRLPDYFEEAVTIRDWAGEGELGVDDYARSLQARGALDNVGPEVFHPDLIVMEPVALGRLCRSKTDEFLDGLGATG